MNIDNKDAYNNSIFIATIVNADSSQDPEEMNRVQIYIPSDQYEFNDLYKDYMNASDKPNHSDYSKFPWAKSLVKDLKVGNIVYCSNINNLNSEYVVLGLDAYNPKNETSEDSGTAYEVSGSSLLDLTMPIILRNEVSMPLNCWPNNIPTEKYTYINAYDKGCKCKDKSTCPDSGGWSIGIIQWHHSRAYNLLKDIVSNDSNWENSWGSNCRDTDLYSDLKGQKDVGGEYGSDFHPQPGTDLGNCIQNLLGSDKGKETQRNEAAEDTTKALNKLQNTYKITNPMVVIYLADIMNQHPSIPDTCRKAQNVCNNGGDMKSQFDQVVESTKSNLGGLFSNYTTRRNNTISYINQLYEQGKFSSGGAVDEGPSSVVSGGPSSKLGFIFPVEGGNKKGWIRNKTYPSYTGHTGVDIGVHVSDGKNNILAVADGKVICSRAIKNSSGGYRSYGEYVVIDHNNGYCTAYAHMHPNSRRVATGDSVKQGQVLGKVGDTGNSHGAHLHFEVRRGKNQTSNGRAINPLPFLP